MASATKPSAMITLLAWMSLISVTMTLASPDELFTDPPGSETRNVTAHYCPFPCTMGGEWACYPPPCVPPICVHPTKTEPTDCCEICPEGPDCSSPDGVPIRYYHWRIVSGMNCTCRRPPLAADCV